jgi:hypothetical protein
MSRLRNLWKLSEIEMPPEGNKKPMVDRIKEFVTGKHPATIIDTEEKPDLFPEHDSTLK